MQNIMKLWLTKIEFIDYAFQPIVNIHTGKVIAQEALLRNYKEAGFSSIDAFFDQAYHDKVLHRVDILLRHKALEKFIDSGFDQYARLFYNLDNRIIEMFDYKEGETSKLLEELHVKKSLITFEVSEKYEFKSFIKAQSLFNLYQKQGYKIAIDDFGTGFSGLKLLYHSEPNYIKIDRFFITDIFKDTKKKLFISNIITIAHSIGAIVIAEGVETQEEFYMCKEIGCDMVQGYFVAHPQTDVEKLLQKYEHVKEIAVSDKRSIKINRSLKTYLKEVPSISVDSKMDEIFEKFRNNSFSYFVVVDDKEMPIGILKEKKLGNYIYNPYGNSLLTNKILSEKLDEFLTRCSSVEANSDISEIIRAFSFNNKADGVIITKNYKYEGFIDSRSILDYLNHKNIADAANQNPLTRLPGNKNIEEFIQKSINREGREVIFTYFDFDNFKPFNDRYGFRNGDRAILLFTDLLRKYFHKINYFIGHIGGDDFFMGCLLEDEQNFEEIMEEIGSLISCFAKDVESFYEAKDREKGYLEGIDRHGAKVQFPLLTVSAAVLFLRAQSRNCIDEDVSKEMACLKKLAKKDPNGIASSSLL